MPSIESLFLHYKLEKRVDEAFSERHRKVLNSLICTTPELLFGSMSRLAIDCPHFLEFFPAMADFESLGTLLIFVFEPLVLEDEQTCFQ